MCGIAGIVQANASPEVLADKAKRMANAIYHRGPDSDGVWASLTHPLALSHRRLSILDLSPLGNQPMLSPSGNSVIAFNGEIYNFSSIRSNIEKAGIVFRGHSDTEVLLAAIDHYGFDTAIEKAKGMFSIAHWDAVSGKLRLARDRIGEKPLYYGIINNCFVFASELKAIYQLYPAKELAIDLNALNSFLRYGYISAPQTIFSGICKLPPGFKLELDIGAWTKSKSSIDDFLVSTPYWRVADHITNTRAYNDSEADVALKDFDQLLNKVIQEQSTADVPLGAFLSGGIDSSLVSAVLQAQSQRAIETFTIGFHEKEFNEAVHAKQIAQQLGSSHNELYLSAKDALEVIPSLPQIYDEPFADASQIPTYLISKFARSKLTVCLSGDGGDELFLGYNRYSEGERFSRLSKKIPTLLTSASAAAIKRIPPHIFDHCYSSFNSAVRRKGGANFGLKVHKAASAITYNAPNDLYQFLCSYSQKPSNLISRQTENRKLTDVIPFDSNFFDAAMAWDQQWYLPGDTLVKSDRASMAVSLEMRAPLLDKELIEFSWTVPNSMKLRDGKTKWLMRQLLCKYVPQKLIERPKMGFSVPIGHWIRDELRDWSHSLLSKSFLEEQGFFNSEAVGKLLQDHIDRKFEHTNTLWTLLMFQSWYRDVTEYS